MTSDQIVSMSLTRQLGHVGKRADVLAETRHVQWWTQSNPSEWGRCASTTLQSQNLSYVRARIVVEMGSHTTKLVPVQYHTTPFSTKGLEKSLCDFTGTTVCEPCHACCVPAVPEVDPHRPPSPTEYGGDAQCSALVLLL